MKHAILMAITLGATPTLAEPRLLPSGAPACGNVMNRYVASDPACASSSVEDVAAALVDGVLAAIGITLPRARDAAERR